MSFRENLKSELSYQGILVKELAQKTGISKRTLDNYLREKSSQPPVDVALKIANALNVTVEYLMIGEVVADEKKEEDVNTRLFNKYIKTIRKIDSLPENKKSLVLTLIDELQ